MRTRQLSAILVLAVIAGSSFVPASQAASPPSERASSFGLMAHFEQWLLGVVDHVERVLGLGAPTAAPTGDPDPRPSSILRDCGSAIDPNGGNCTT
jgi:hypothetical protein